MIGAAAPKLESSHIEKLSKFCFVCGKSVDWEELGRIDLDDPLSWPFHFTHTEEPDLLEYLGKMYIRLHGSPKIHPAAIMGIFTDYLDNVEGWKYESIVGLTEQIERFLESNGWGPMK